MKTSTREKLFKRAMFMCEYDGCNGRGTEIAHRIANTQENIRMIQRILKELYKLDTTKEFVKKNIINSEHNLAVSCRAHNDYFNCGYDNAKVMKIIAKCMEDI